MKALWAAMFGTAPAVALIRLADVSPWLIVVFVSAALILGLVHNIFPQDSADRLHFLLTFRERDRRFKRVPQRNNGPTQNKPTDLPDLGHS